MTHSTKRYRNGYIPAGLSRAMDKRASAERRILMGESRRMPKLADLELRLTNLVLEGRFLNMDMVLDLAVKHNASAYEAFRLMVKVGYVF